MTKISIIKMKSSVGPFHFPMGRGEGRWRFGHLDIEDWNLFVIWELRFGI
jgi:hypothetical protein